MNTINKLAEYFSQFPGIGPRQSKRFVYFLLTRNHRFLDELSELLQTLKAEASTCTSCQRFFVSPRSEKIVCDVCGDKNRNTAQLMIVARDTDFENIERSRVYDGRYFILGGTVELLESNPQKNVRLDHLVQYIKSQIDNGGLDEIIFAFSVNPDGENTTRFISELLSPFVQKHNIKLSVLGRGLSTGTELEYPDSETIKNALLNRKVENKIK